MGFTAPKRLKSSRSRTSHGFTLAEVIIAGAVLALFIVGSVSAMAQINRWASVARLRTLALAVTQQKIDQIMTTSWSVLAPTPTVLTAGTTTETNLPLNNDSFNNETGLSSAFSNLDTPESVTRVTQVTSLATRTVRAVVTVTYTYRGRAYSVSMTTLRASDDF
jgi:type II secretory pathway pseudopilin PulG